MSTDPSPTPPNGLQLLSQASAITHQVQLTVPALSSSGYGNVHASSMHNGVGSGGTGGAMMGHAPSTMAFPHNPQQQQQQQQLQQQQFVQPLTQPPPPPAPPKPKRQRPPKRKPPTTVGALGQAPAPSPAKVSKPKISPAVLKQRLEDEVFTRKMYFLKRTIKALVFKNAALCDEVARLNQRIHTVTEERKMLVKRVQHHERNRLKKLLLQQKKNATLTPKTETSSPGPLLDVKIECSG